MRIWLFMIMCKCRLHGVLHMPAKEHLPTKENEANKVAQQAANDKQGKGAKGKGKKNANQSNSKGKGGKGKSPSSR